MSPSSVLFQNASKTVVLLDLPRTLEEAQVLYSSLAGNVAPPRRLVSAPPTRTPFPTPEPKTRNPSSAPLSAQVADLMTAAAAEAALAELHQSHSGPWHLPRICSRAPPPSRSPCPSSSYTKPTHYLPPASHYLNGTISACRTDFLASLPPRYFNLIVLDPPWPNRSARRKRNAYQPVTDFSSLRELLSLIPVASHLAPDGLVAVWVTNSARAAEVLTAPRDGVFPEWDVELVGEWTWLKVTTEGEPVVGLESTWRRPWERLMIARKRSGKGAGPVPNKVIVSVPDVHSRKPSLRGLFEELLPREYHALEVFARNLTAGWWSWGDEVLLFQEREHWIATEDAPSAERSRDAVAAGSDSFDHTS